MKKQDNLGNRMKEYENVSKPFLTLRCPKIIRLDMRAGHTFTKGMKKPYDMIFASSMQYAAKRLCEEIAGTVFGYVQSDEISLLINDITDNEKTNCFFNGNLEKIVSLSASICTLAFNQKFLELATQSGDDLYLSKCWKAMFDSRAFVLPSVIEAHNYFVWRQQDATKNSISSLAYTKFSQKELLGKDSNEKQEMLWQAYGINWNDYSSEFKRGCGFVHKGFEHIGKTPDGKEVPVVRHRWEKVEVPIFTKDLSWVQDRFDRKEL